MDEEQALQILENIGYEQEINDNIFVIKRKAYLNVDEFSTEDNELYKNECYIVGFVGGNAIAFIIDTVTAKIYESLGKNDDGKRVLKLAKKNTLKDLDDINKYYRDLGAEPYWTGESLNFNIVKKITLTFSMLHELYPKVKIKEIGDLYSYDKIKRENNIKNLEHNLSNKNYYDDFNVDEEFKDVLKQKAENELQYNINNEITLEYNMHKNKYSDLDYVAKYYPNDMQIVFNHSISQDYSDNLIHEFGHAITSQYYIGEYDGIKNFYNSLTSGEITSKISQYATKNINEFIAECFAKSFACAKNDIANKVRNRIDEIVNTTQPCTLEEFFKGKFNGKYK